MASSALKSAEIFFRRALLRLLSALVRRRGTLPPPNQLSSARVLLLRQDRIGDVLVSTPFVRSLAARFPGMSIDMLVSENNMAALEGIPAVRQAWVYRKKFWSTVQLVRHLRHTDYDVAVDLMDNPSATSTLFSLFSGARCVVGLSKSNDFAYDVSVPLRSRRDVHIVERIAELLRPFGIDPGEEDLRITFAVDTTKSELARSIVHLMKPGGRFAIGINISAGSDVRYWGTERFVDLVKGLYRPNESDIIILSKGADRRRAEDVVKGSGARARLVSTQSFAEFAAVVHHLSLLITPDTSAIHLASAFQVPCVGLFIQVDPSLRIWDPYRSPHRSLVSSSNTLTTISVSEVIEAAALLLKEGRNPRSTRRKGK